MSQLQHPQNAYTDELLSTKLTPPRLRTGLVLRKPLLARLDEGLERKLTLLSAPPGFGKTTLAGQWLTTIQNPRVAWVSLDTGDNDPVRFWNYVITACQPFDPAIGRSSLDLLRTSQQPSFEIVLTTFINELAQLPDRSVLVLEDYHVITSGQIHELVTFLLDHLPTSLHLIMITRSDPPLPLARLRASNDLSELRAADLRFSLAETQTFLQEIIQLPLSAQVIERLDARTEGWIAGLRLVALALQRRQERQEIEQFLATFSGSHGHILEYLVEEVLRTQPEPLQEFLLQTTFLSCLTGSLCDAVTGRNDSATLLENLERANLFLSPLDGAGQWYRYHALFAEAMQHYARPRFGEAHLRQLSYQASRWYEQHGLLAEAVEASLAAQEFDRTADLINRLIAPRLVHNEYHTLRRWMERLPEAAIRPYPTLCLTYAIAILFTSDRQAPATAALLRRPLELAEQAWQAEGNRPKLGEVLTFRSLVAWLQGDFSQSFAAARQGLELLPAEDIQWRAVGLIFVGVEELWAGKLNTARQTLLQALTLSKTAGNIYATLDTTTLLGQICAGQGELRQAAQLYRQVLAEAERVPMPREQALLRKGRALTGLSALDLEWNALETAEQAAAQALDLSRQLADEHLLVASSLIRARVWHARGEIALAQQLLHTVVAQIKRPSLLREVHAALAWLAVAAGDLAAGQRWSATINSEAPRPQQEQEALIKARLLIAQGEVESALRLLDSWQAEAHMHGRFGGELEMMLLKALACFSHSNLPQAKETLLKALALAQPEGYQRLFLNEGQRMATLLQAVLPELSEEALATYGRSLLNSFVEEGAVSSHFEWPNHSFVHVNTELEHQHEIQSQRPPVGNLTSPAPGRLKIQNLVEPLSPQEQRVLCLLAGGLSNPEIAEELIVSINTIKTQVKSIYRKLNVNSRKEARQAARQLNLL